MMTVRFSLERLSCFKLVLSLSGRLSFDVAYGLWLTFLKLRKQPIGGEIMADKIIYFLK